VEIVATACLRVRCLGYGVRKSRVILPKHS
jgi:hypothetical protein